MCASRIPGGPIDAGRKRLTYSRLPSRQHSTAPVSLDKPADDSFVGDDLPEPERYVRPAWTISRIDLRDLDKLPFRQYETLVGIYDSGARSFRRTAMVGFEADTAFRALSCRIWNRLNLWVAGTSKPVRVAIHPRDLQLLLADDLRAFLGQGGQALSYRGIEFQR